MINKVLRLDFSFYFYVLKGRIKLGKINSDRKTEKKFLLSWLIGIGDKSIAQISNNTN